MITESKNTVTVPFLSTAADTIASLRRRFQKQLLRRSFSVTPAPGLERLGTTYGGWVVPTQLLHPGAVCVCAGAGEDVSFDVELAERFGCRVIVLDPTPRAIQHVRSLFDATRRGDSMMINHRKGQIYHLTEEGMRHLQFEESGLWDQNETLRFFAPKDREHVSHSALNLQGTEDSFEAPVLTLKSIQEEFEVNSLTVLKLDIEGAEYRVLDSLERDGLRPKVICVEFDEGHQPLDESFGERITEAVQKLENRQYRLVHNDCWDFTFVDELVLNVLHS